MHKNPWLSAIGVMWRTLTFRATAEDYENATWHAYLIGFMTVWLAGIGRTWDDPEVDLARRTGIGSLVYVVFLSLLILAFAHPVSRRKIGFLPTLLFVSMTALPALIYAVPVELWTDMAVAQAINLGFLIFVAGYRVSMYVRFLSSCAEVKWFDAVLATTLPLMLILIGVSIFGLSGRVIDIMGGLEPRDPNVHDAADGVVFFLTGLSCLAVLPLLIAHIVRSIAIAQWEQRD